MDFGARTFELPECHSVPRTKFDVDRKTKRGNPVYANVHGFDHAGALRELQRHVFGPEVQHDHRLLSRIVYRNRNQHRGSVHFRRFEELRRGLKILQGLQIPVLVDRIQAAFYPVGVSRKRRAEWQMLPCRYYMTAVVGRLVWVGRFLEKLQMVCHRCFVQCTGQVAVTLFMPLMIVVQGIAARLQVVLRLWHRSVADIAGVLERWLLHLPACPDSLSGPLPSLPDLDATAEPAKKPVEDVDEIIADIMPDLSIQEPAKKKRARHRTMDIYSDFS